MKDELITLAREVKKLHKQIHEESTVPDIEVSEIRELLASRFPFSVARSLSEITGDVDNMLYHWTLHTNHPRHFGLFQPSLSEIGVVADALVAAYNPQVGAWWFSPAANEIERYALNFITRKFGCNPENSFACFTSGGSESTTSAVVCALTQHFPSYADEGIPVIGGQPRVYLSTEAHDSMEKIAHQTGIGRTALCRITTDSHKRLLIDELAKLVTEDRQHNKIPFLVIATAGTTAVGAIDPLPELLQFCQTENLWLHVDAAWGGGSMFSPSQRKLLEGIEGADSITWDPHKSFPIPTGAGYFFCKHPQSVKDAFRVNTSYVPDEVEGHPDLYRLGLQWSRRFIGLKVFMTIAEMGENGLERMINHQADMGDYLRRQLLANGWKLENTTALPVVCFTHPDSPVSTQEIVDRVLQRKKCWISGVKLSDGRLAIRTCITSHKTQKPDIDDLIKELALAIQK